MNDEQKRAEEAQAMERVVNATRQVQVAFTALLSQYPPQGSGKPSKIALQTFDDSRPACRTLVAVDGTEVTPFEGVPDCKGWDGLLTEDGAVWSVIPKEHQVENAHFYARSGDAYVDLGPGTAGSLTWCAGAAYFVRDPQREGDPAALMRWSADSGLAVVYESPGGQAFLSEPRCGGDSLTVTALAEDGDEQVTAPLS